MSDLAPKALKGLRLLRLWDAARGTYNAAMALNDAHDCILDAKDGFDVVKSAMKPSMAEEFVKKHLK